MLTSTIKEHAASADKVMALESPLLNALLGSDVPSCEENSGGHALGEQRLSSELSIIPLIGTRLVKRCNGNLAKVGTIPAEE